jgi:hypothetical protein
MPITYDAQMPIQCSAVILGHEYPRTLTEAVTRMPSDSRGGEVNAHVVAEHVCGERGKYRPRGEVEVCREPTE